MSFLIGWHLGTGTGETVILGGAEVSANISVPSISANIDNQDIISTNISMITISANVEMEEESESVGFDTITGNIQNG